MAATSSPADTMPSSHQWLPVATTANTVNPGWRSISHRHGLVLTAITAMDMNTAQPTCTDGMAAS